MSAHLDRDTVHDELPVFARRAPCQQHQRAAERLEVVVYGEGALPPDPAEDGDAKNGVEVHEHEDHGADIQQRRERLQQSREELPQAADVSDQPQKAAESEESDVEFEEESDRRDHLQGHNYIGP